jgi:hypothetical protein
VDAATAAEALDLTKNGARFDLVITDGCRSEQLPGTIDLMTNCQGMRLYKEKNYSEGSLATAMRDCREVVRKKSTLCQQLLQWISHQNGNRNPAIDPIQVSELTYNVNCVPFSTVMLVFPSEAVPA